MVIQSLLISSDWDATLWTDSQHASNTDLPTPSTICLLPITHPHYSPDGSTDWHLKIQMGVHGVLSISLCLYFSLTLKYGLHYTHAHTPTRTAHWDKASTSEGDLNSCFSFFFFFSDQNPKHTFHKFMAPNVLNLTFCLRSASSSQQMIFVPEGQLLLNASLLLHHEPRSWLLHVLKAKVKIYNSFASSDSSASLFILFNKW